MLIGLHCSHEQIPPSRLLAHAAEAEAAGFGAAMSSDHFSPWSERQGESGFAWSFLGAAMQATSLPWGVVNAPVSATTRLDMLFSFTVNQAMYLALAREDAAPLVAALEALPPIPQDCQWANFVRNHDELTLDKLAPEEREEVFAAFGPDPGMQMYGRGLRRRLPAMLGGDQRRIRMVYSLMFSLPGTPVLFYGEEIGMAENLAIEGRYAVRSPMQWSDEPHAGFTTGDEPCRPLPADGPFAYGEVNVARQRREPGSLLNWMERLIRRRRECPELGWGDWTLLPQDEPAVLAHRADWEGSTIVAVHNLGGRAAQARLALGEEGLLVDLLGGDDVDAGGGEPELALEPYGHRWFRLRRPGQRVAP